MSQITSGLIVIECHRWPVV